MNLPVLMADMRATLHWPTDAEVELIVREGTLGQVAEAMVIGCCTNQPLRARYRELYAASMRG